VRCRVPRGAGRAAVAVSTPLQTSSAGTGVHAVYAAPEVADVSTVLGRPIEGGFPVVVKGVVSGVGVGEWGGGGGGGGGKGGALWLGGTVG
jgi:hypothetical protein